MDVAGWSMLRAQPSNAVMFVVLGAWCLVQRAMEERGFEPALSHEAVSTLAKVRACLGPWHTDSGVWGGQQAAVQL